MQIIYEKITNNEGSIFLFKAFDQLRFTSPKHYHTEYEITLIPSGYGKLFVGNSIVDFEEGNIYMFSPHLAHCFQNPADFENAGIRAQAFVIQFDPDFLGEKFLESEQAAKLRSLLVKSKYGIRFNQSKQKLEEIFNEIKKSEGLNSVSILLKLLDELSQWDNTTLLNVHLPDQKTNPKDLERLNKVFEYVADNFKGEISFTKAANIANMQEAAFSRYFKRRTQKTFSYFVNELRIANANKLLSDTDKGVAEICFESGFENLSYFNRQFKLINKVSPSEFKKVTLKC